MKLNNMKSNLLKTVLGISLAVIAQSTFAGTNSPAIDKKQANQKGRISQGIRSGQLTAREAARLGKQQRRIYREERRFKADGQFTRRERAKVHFDLAKSSRNIYRQKHDRQVRGHHPAKKMGIHQRQKRQAHRIGQGVRSGALTARETVRLGKQQIHIQRQKRRFKSDGVLTKREQVRIQHRQNRASRSIYRLKHNKRKRH